MVAVGGIPTTVMVSIGFTRGHFTPDYSMVVVDDQYENPALYDLPKLGDL